MYWMEDLPPLAREALYQDANVIGKLIAVFSFKKKN